MTLDTTNGMVTAGIMYRTVSQTLFFVPFVCPFVFVEQEFAARIL